MAQSSSNTRRTLIILIVVLALAQVGILAYRGTLLRPAAPREAAGPAPLQLAPPSATGTAIPGNAQPTLAPGLVEIVVGPPVPATDYADGARMFDEERALAHLAYLASDALGGRQPGTPGGRAAGDYIAARFAEHGLEPAGPDGTYFQTFSAPYGRITEPPGLTVIPPQGETLTRTYAYRTDYRALTGGYLGAGAGEGPVVWLNECRHDDYAGLDMVGKIVLCRYTRDAEVYRQAIEHQVGGLLLLDREREDALFRRGGYRETAWVPQTIPAYLISKAVGQDLLVGTDYTLDDLSLRFTATPLSTTVALAVTVVERDEVEARNVLALLPGSEAEHSDEVVVIGAHYDHLGREPDGAIMNGANDNGSGVATMLEIARLWRAQGFRPARSVLFAAWDGEEQGLLGSRHYVQSPTVPLTRTVAALNLDMVGAGEMLQIDGEGTVAAQLQASASVYGITATLTGGPGRSDHLSFHEAGVPAAMLIWWPDPLYHTPDDEVEAVEPQKLKTVGVLSAHALAALAQGHVELEQAVARLRAGTAAGDREAFLEGVDPTDPDLRAAQAAWFDNLWSRDLTGVTVEPGQMRVGDGEAGVTLRMAYDWADTARREPSVLYDVRFVQRNDTWTFGGYELDVLSGDVVTVARFFEVPVGARQLLSTTERAYLALTADLGLEPVTGTHFIYYPNTEAMRCIARPAAGHDMRWLVPSAGLAEIASGQPITPAVVNLALNQMGLPPDEGAWLREGLALHYEDDAEREHLPILATTDVLTPLLDFPALSDLPDAEARALRAYAWSATEYLLDRYGITGLRALCAAWGRSNGHSDNRSDDFGRSAFQEALNVSPEQFESAWRAARLAPLRADAGRIRASVAARVDAALGGNEAGFLSTVTLTDPALRTEERDWFADLATHPLVTYSLAGELVGWSPGGHEAVVALSVKSAITGAQPIQVSYDARFVRERARWLYAGAAWSELTSEHFVLKHQNQDEAWARRVLDLAEAAYAQVTADLDGIPRLPQEVKLYDDGELFRASVSPSLPEETTGWTAPGAAIKLWLQDDGDDAVQRAIARELAHQVLFAQGLETDWLREGAARFEAGRVIPLGSHWTAARCAPVVQEALRHHDEFPPHRMPRREDVPDAQAGLFSAQSWSLVSFVVERHGLSGLRRLIAQSAGVETRPAADTAANLRAALGVDPEDFLAAWREYARVAGVPDDLVSLAGRFDADRALAHIAVLSSPEFGGREAGAPGADTAAAYIAGQFAALGLRPVLPPLAGGDGDLSPTLQKPGSTIPPLTGGDGELSPTLQKPDSTIPPLIGGGRGGYLQRFPISHTHLLRVPTLTLLDGEGAMLHEFAYREDFVEAPTTSLGHGGAHTVQGELVWVHTEDLEGMRFGGAVVLERDVRDPVARATELQEHGAGGLIVATDKEPWQFQVGRTQPVSGSAVTIPVFEITGAAFETLLGQLGIKYRDLSFAPPALPLGAQVEQTLVHTPHTTTFTSNVLGLLPGSAPDLADEVLVVGAHYDHVGRSPDGVYFPGANRNASGVGALLEMARVWQATGYRPARSVLFAAWGAEELDGAGVAHYLAHPAVPLTQTVGVIALDSVGGGRGYRLLFYGAPKHDLPLIHRLEAGTAVLERRAQWKGKTGEGWHAQFSAAGIPTVKLIWEKAEDDFYLPTNTADRIDPERLAFSGQVLTLAASWLGGPAIE